MLPQISNTFIKRKKLCDIFDDEQKSVFLIYSRVGSGKTNIMAQYCRNKEGEVLWYSFDKTDNEEKSFLKHFIYGISKIDKDAGEKLNAYEESCVKLTKHLTKVLINTLLEVAERMKQDNKQLYMVLDGFQCIENQNILQLFKLLLKCLSGEIKLFILTSSVLQRCFSKYMTEGNYRKITEKELFFTMEEIKKIAEQGFEKRKIKKEYIQRIEELTGGWPVAVECLFRFLAENEEEISIVLKMEKENLLMETVLYDYIYWEIYGKFSRNEREFLLKTAGFHELDARLCDNCLKGDDSKKILHSFLNHHILELVCERDKKYFRYFELFRLFLMEEGEKKVQEKMGERASCFYLQNKQYDKAVFYAQNNIKQLSNLLEQYGKKMLRENRLDLLMQCINKLLGAQHEFSVLQLEIVAEYYYRTGHYEQMEYYLNCADSMFGKENKYSMYRSLYRALFHYEEDTEKYEKQINNVLFSLAENKIPYPYLLEREQGILCRAMKEKNVEQQETEKKKIQVSTFGTFRAVIIEDGKELPWRTKKGCELFAYLLDCGGKAMERKTLLSELWKTEIPNNAVAMLHNMFYNMRKELSYYNLEHIIQYKSKKYSMDVSLIQSDLQKMQLVSHYVEEKNVEKLWEHKEVFVTYKGLYLEDMDNTWIREKQDYYEKIFEKGCCILGEKCMEQKKYEEALVYLKNGLAISVYSENIVSQILQCYHHMGDFKGAKKQYEEFCTLLKEELNLIPGEYVQKIYQECMMR